MGFLRDEPKGELTLRQKLYIINNEDKYKPQQIATDLMIPLEKVESYIEFINSPEFYLKPQEIAK